MQEEEKWMRRCIELASAGLGHVAPNPLVGSVIVCDSMIVGEGYHQRFGEAHAERNAITDALRKNPMLDFSSCTLYVNLEPCNHTGKTPPCTEEIIRRKFGKVVIGSEDPNPLVNGSGVRRLRENGIEVVSGILQQESEELNKRFFTFHRQKRPWIILKFAQSLDGFIAPANITEENRWLSNPFSRRLVHKWRSEEQAIMAGTNTIRTDNPFLTVREWSGKNPLRIIIDRNLSLGKQLNVFNPDAPMIVLNEIENRIDQHLEYVKITFNADFISVVMKILADRGIQSLIVEGGARLISEFTLTGIWDEARIFIADKWLGEGVSSPLIPGKEISKTMIGTDQLLFIQNQSKHEFTN